MLAMLKTLPSDCVRSEIDSPVGRLTLIASSKGLHAVLWPIDRNDVTGIKRASHPVIEKTARQLEQYFAGERTRFDLPLVWDGTPFQVRAWKELARIPYGETISYQEQARRMGDRKKARAVGMANARNPISIVVPCHRVIAKDGALSGFGGGVRQKATLLELESRSEKSAAPPRSRPRRRAARDRR
jgi:methylated-DNA-[protein]-cysteine S-methyltransferase